MPRIQTMLLLASLFGLSHGHLAAFDHNFPIKRLASVSQGGETLSFDYANPTDLRVTGVCTPFGDQPLTGYGVKTQPSTKVSGDGAKKAIDGA